MIKDNDNKYNISALLNSENKVKYIVPKYQREYIWGKREWETFFMI